eukprot:7389346-Prymnesium_polylepis.2
MSMTDRRGRGELARGAGAGRPHQVLQARPHRSTSEELGSSRRVITAVSALRVRAPHSTQETAMFRNLTSFTASRLSIKPSSHRR